MVKFSIKIHSVQLLSRVRFFATPWTEAHQAFILHQLSELAQTHPMSWWCHPTISSSVVLFSSCLQSFPASESFPMSLFFASGDQSIGASSSASVLPMNIQDWFPLGWTGLISWQSKGLKSLLQHYSSKASILWFSAYDQTLTSIYYYWKNHGFWLCGLLLVM